MSESDSVRHYAGDVDVAYEARRCVHAAGCLYGRRAVATTARRPWILPASVGADAIAAVIGRCPSGALRYVRGRVRLRSAGCRALVEETRVARCRCGQSGNTPFCDHSPRAASFADPGAVSG
jgi:uncharacterized Fe-S cluster protein YjdI